MTQPLRYPDRPALTVTSILLALGIGLFSAGVLLMLV